MKLFFSAIDIFPYKINFNYKRYDNFHSIIGFIFSFLVYFILLLCLYKFSEDCIQKQNPHLSLKEKLLTNETKINFTQILDSLNYTYNILLYTNNTSENITEVIRNYYHINFYIYNCFKVEIMNFYYNDFQNFRIMNITSNYSNNMNNNSSNNYTNYFRFLYNITFDAFIDRKTLFKYKYFSDNVLNSKKISQYFIYTDYNKLSTKN